MIKSYILFYVCFNIGNNAQMAIFLGVVTLPLPITSWGIAIRLPWPHIHWPSPWGRQKTNNQPFWVPILTSWSASSGSINCLSHFLQRSLPTATKKTLDCSKAVLSSPWCTMRSPLSRHNSSSRAEAGAVSQKPCMRFLPKTSLTITFSFHSTHPAFTQSHVAPCSRVVCTRRSTQANVKSTQKTPHCAYPSNHPYLLILHKQPSPSGWPPKVMQFHQQEHCNSTSNSTPPPTLMPFLCAHQERSTSLCLFKR